MTDATLVGNEAPAKEETPANNEKPDTEKKPANTGDGGGGAAGVVSALGPWKVFILALVVLAFIILLTAFLAWKAFDMSGTGDARWARGIVVYDAAIGFGSFLIGALLGVGVTIQRVAQANQGIQAQKEEKQKAQTQAQTAQQETKAAQSTIARQAALIGEARPFMAAHANRAADSSGDGSRVEVVDDEAVDELRDLLGTRGLNVRAATGPVVVVPKDELEQMTRPAPSDIPPSVAEDWLESVKNLRPDA